MASIKVKFRPSSVDGNEGSIYYQIIHGRKVRQLPTSYKIFPNEWDEARSAVVTTSGSERKTFILSIKERIRWDIECLSKLNLELDNNGIGYTTDDIIDEFRRYVHEYSLFNFMESVIAMLKRNGKERTSETYRSSLNSFKNFRDGEDILLEFITPEIMESYEAWLKKRGVASNTISFYSRILRAVYNRAVESGNIENRHPFRRVYTGVDKTVKRALPLKTVKMIRMLDLRKKPALDYARDMFLMSFYLRGMSFIDMAFLKKTDRQNGYIMYRRRKTGQQLVVEWTKEMQLILDKYPENLSEYLFPIIRNPCSDERRVYHNAAYNINKHLKKIAEMIKIPMPLTLYVARHSWASAARSKGIPVSVISEGMGHESEATTRIYLASLDTSLVDRANALIIKSLK